MDSFLFMTVLSAVLAVTAACPEIACQTPCAYGFQEFNGCPTCTCNPAVQGEDPACDMVHCFAPCDSGYEMDGSNCLTCQCAPDSAVRVFNANFGASVDDGPNACPPVYCFLPCESYQEDDAGCLTCICAASMAKGEDKQLPADKIL